MFLRECASLLIGVLLYEKRGQSSAPAHSRPAAPVSGTELVPRGPTHICKGGARGLGLSSGGLSSSCTLDCVVFVVSLDCERVCTVIAPAASHVLLWFLCLMDPCIDAGSQRKSLPCVIPDGTISEAVLQSLK